MLTNRIKHLCLIAALCLAAHLQAFAASDRIDLSGMWRFQLDPLGFGKTPGSELYLAKLAETIVLPGSTDTGGKGIKNNARYVDRLSRKFEYQGPAWYQREVEVPRSWQGKHIELHLERCHWETTVYVDGKPAGSDERLSTPNRFDLSNTLTPGMHTITLCVDNRLKYPMDNWTHGTTEYTQTNWNGIIGDMSLLASETVYINKVNAIPDIHGQRVKAKVEVCGLRHGKQAQMKLLVREKKGRKVVATTTVNVDSASAARGIEAILPMGSGMKLWDEFAPFLYELETTVSADDKSDVRNTTFGMRSVEQGRHHVRLNGHDIHLRGVLDCAVFPLTGYPSTNPTDWKRIFSTIKSYGMNHVRFHSWCPPEAAFEAADEIGMYIQAELPMWIKDVGKYPARRDFFEKEMYAVLDEYGNHPSFILMCGGNENEGDFDVLEDLVRKAQTYDNRRLYSASTARTHVKADQFYVSHVTDKGWITVYEGQPSTDWDRSATSGIDVPVIAHETGQRCMYPNFDEIGKYSGVLEARNMEVFRERLARGGMLHQAHDFFTATGAHTVLQYKEVNESLLRTANSGGFQLLGLADFPGQGSAFVGILDAFWESKGLITPEKFRESCAPTVLLARIKKRTFTPSDTLTVKMGVYHFAPQRIKGQRLAWNLTDESGNMYASGRLKGKTTEPYTVDSLGTFSISLRGIAKTGKYTLRAQLGNISNEWNIWVFTESGTSDTDGIMLARRWDDSVRHSLEEGRDVLLVPQEAIGRKTKFASHFWNPIMFRWNPMIVGTLIDNSHPALADFPTDNYADWQWWDILNNAHAIEMDALHGVTPIVQSIDSYESNHKLGIVFEARVGKGRLMVANVDIDNGMDSRPATSQLLRSLCHYMRSTNFAPKASVKTYEIDTLFEPATNSGGNTSDAATRQLLNKL